jgi:peptidoglycan/LPS O-acetylase OafA/YrhL
MNFQLCFFPQYILAFIFGSAAARQGWLEELAVAQKTRTLGLLGVLLGPVLLLIVLKLGGPFPEQGANPYAGGLHPQAFGLAFWEQTTAAALGVGMLGWFRRWFSERTRFSQWLSDRSFAVYVLHAPILVALTFCLRPPPGGVFEKMLLLTFAGLIGSFLAGDLARRIRGLRSIL